MQAVQPGSLTGVLEGLGRSGAGASVVCVVGDIPDPELRALVTLRGRVGSATVVTGRTAPSASERHPDVVAVGPDGLRDGLEHGDGGQRRRRRAASERTDDGDRRAAAAAGLRRRPPGGRPAMTDRAIGRRAGAPSRRWRGRPRRR